MFKTAGSDRPAFRHPAFDYENRIVTVDLPLATVASIYAPNGGKDFPAKMRFLEALNSYSADFQAAGRRLSCAAISMSRAPIWTCIQRERRPRAIGQLPEERALIESIIGHGLVDVHRQVDPNNAELFTWWAPWRNMKQRNIGWRLLRIRLADVNCGKNRLVHRAARSRNERSRTGHCDF